MSQLESEGYSGGFVNDIIIEINNSASDIIKPRSYISLMAFTNPVADIQIPWI